MKFKFMGGIRIELSTGKLSGELIIRVFYRKMAGTPCPHPKRFRLNKKAL